MKFEVLNEGKMSILIIRAVTPCNVEMKTPIVMLYVEFRFKGSSAIMRRVSQ